MTLECAKYGKQKEITHKADKYLTVHRLDCVPDECNQSWQWGGGQNVGLRGKLFQVLLLKKQKHDKQYETHRTHTQRLL